MAKSTMPDPIWDFVTRDFSKCKARHPRCACKLCGHEWTSREVHRAVKHMSKCTEAPDNLLQACLEKVDLYNARKRQKTTRRQQKMSRKVSSAWRKVSRKRPLAEKALPTSNQISEISRIEARPSKHVLEGEPIQGICDNMRRLSFLVSSTPDPESHKEQEQSSSSSSSTVAVKQDDLSPPRPVSIEIGECDDFGSARADIDETRSNSKYSSELDSPYSVNKETTPEQLFFPNYENTYPTFLMDHESISPDYVWREFGMNSSPAPFDWPF